MIRYWKSMGMPAFLALALASPALAQNSADKPAPGLTPNKGAEPADRSADTQAIMAQLKTLNEDLRAVKDGLPRSFERVKTDMDAIRKDLESVRSDRVTTDLNVTQAQQNIKQLQEHMATLRQEVEELRRRPVAPPSTTSSGYAGSTVPMTGFGRVRLVNTYLEPVTVVVNNRAYQLMPGEQRLTEPLPVGSFTYEVLGITEARTRTLATSDNFTITVHPRG